jgi:hypothetical protein
MAKTITGGSLNYCNNGNSVTDQVIRYQNTRMNDDYLPIQYYYDNYKDIWFDQMAEFFDRKTFESEFDYKLCRAVESFNSQKAIKLSDKNNWSALGMFNRWFYRILRNWQSNVKSSSFRIKKNPSTQCPICGRFVAKIDIEHLSHIKSIRDLPKIFTWKGFIYETCRIPKAVASCWGEYDRNKWKRLLRGQVKSESKYKVSWPWFLANGDRGVCCPFTKKVIPFIDDEYIRSLPDKHNRYAKPYSWEEFVSNHPSHLIQQEIYSLDYCDSIDNLALHEKVSDRSDKTFINYEMICKGKVPTEYENSFLLIDQFFDNDLDKRILKLFTIGYDINDIADSLEIDKKMVRDRIKAIRAHKELMCFKSQLVSEV